MLYIPFWLYSNGTHKFKIIIRLYFTFHSGYILIELANGSPAQTNVLYIPFWLYSNFGDYLEIYVKKTFTFHSGYILI